MNTLATCLSMRHLLTDSQAISCVVGIVTNATPLRDKTCAIGQLTERTLKPAYRGDFLCGRNM
jgi:hypothetical protein